MRDCDSFDKAVGGSAIKLCSQVCSVGRISNPSKMNPFQTDWKSVLRKIPQALTDRLQPRHGFVQVQQRSSYARPGSDFCFVHHIRHGGFPCSNELFGGGPVGMEFRSMPGQQLIQDRQFIRLRWPGNGTAERPCQARFVRRAPVLQNPNGKGSSRLDIAGIVEQRQGLLRRVRPRPIRRAFLAARSIERQQRRMQE